MNETGYSHNRDYKNYYTKSTKLDIKITFEHFNNKKRKKE
jgi:hypothetical protein